MEACSLVGSLQPHLILTDIIMPNMDGIEFIKFLKSSDIFSHIDIFVQTAIEETQKLEEIKQLGVKKIFTKPFKREPMIRAIKDSLLKKMRRAF
jgi:two-component system response regulator YesN